MVYVLQSETIEFCDVIIVERVKDLAPVLPAANQPQLTQSAQLMRDGRLSHLKLCRELTDVHFILEENRDNPQARRIAEGAKEVSQMSRGVFF